MPAVVVDGKAGVEESLFVFSVAHGVIVRRAHLCFRAHDRYQMVSGYNVPYTLDGGPMKLSLAGSAWWRRREIRTGTSTASVPPLKSNRNVEKATFPGACFLVSWVCGRPWPLAICSGSVCGSGPVVCSSLLRCLVSSSVCFKKVRRPRAPTQRPGFPTMVVEMRGDDPRTDLLTGTPFHAWAPYVWYAMTVVLVVAAGYLLWSLSWPLLSSSSSLSLICSNPPVGAGGRTSTCRTGSPWRL